MLRCWLNVTQSLVTSQCHGRRVVCSSTVYDEYHTAIPLVLQVTYVMASVHPLICETVFISHFLHTSDTPTIFKLQTLTWHDCEILTNHGGDSHDVHDYPSADYLGMDVIHLPLVIAMPWDLLSHAVVFKAQMRA